MAPARRKGANKAKAANELRLGDLVLAKVKGFPAWPAKVSNPEDWERASDPKKYFVQFFGTQEIAFIVPADIQTFTSESKTKLLARCKGKTVKYFAQAVKEICEAYEELQTNDISGHGGDAASPEHDASNVDGGIVNGSHTELSRGPKSEEIDTSDSVLDHTSLLGGCPGVGNLLKRIAVEESKAAGDFREMPQKVTEKGRDLPTEALVASPLGSSSNKEEAAFGENRADTAAHVERIESSRASSSSPYGGYSVMKQVVGHNEDGKKGTPTFFGASGNLKISAGRDKKSANGHKSLELIGVKRKIEGVIHRTDDAKSGGSVKDGISGKLSAGGYAKRLSSGVSKLETSPHGKVLQSVLKDRKLLYDGKISPKDAVVASKEFGDVEYTRRKDRQIGQDQIQSIKKAKQVHMISDAAKGSTLKSGKGNMELEIHGEEAVPAKLHRLQLEVTSDINVSSEDKRISGFKTVKTNMPRKRRAVCLYNDDDDDDPKTPVHGGSLPASKAGSSGIILDSVRKTDENGEHLNCGEENLRVLNGDGGGSQKFCLPSDKLVGETSTPSSLQPKGDNSTKSQVSQILGKEELDKQLVKEDKADLVSPAKSPLVAVPAKRLVDQPKPNKPSVKGTGLSSHIKAHNVPVKDSKSASGVSNSFQSQVSSQKSRQTLSGERTKSISKMSVRLNGPASSLDNQKNYDPVLDDGRLEDAKDRSGSLVDSKALDSAMSMKHLIAAAQAKRRLAHIQNVHQGDENSVAATTSNLHGKSPSPLSTGHDHSSGVGNVAELDAQGSHLRGSFASSPFHTRQLASHNPSEIEETEDKRTGSGHQSHQAAGNTLSGGTEAAVARDAFEGMIETLSRTKESIGRATRLAIDCAKYGIANEVVELLIRKLENEPNFRRRVDLLFLVDSITQCSHSQKGIAGASYIPTVQAALPRLLGAAAPPGANARENRQQCLKVLRLWLERKILPEPVLRRFMDDIVSSNDDTSTGVSFRRPSRAERSVDDPIREMEGMLVDEYGSNATFNLPGFLCSHGFVDDDEDEEDVPSKSSKEFDLPLLQLPNNLADVEIGKDTPNDRRHHILEEVDGELEMEDVSGHPKDGAFSPTGSSKNKKQEMQLDTQLECSPNDLVDSRSLEGSPPLPLESPPPLPPLPSSPPPPPPPPLSPSPPPPPPPMLSSQPPPSMVSLGPLQAGNLQPLLPPQPSKAPQVLLRPPSVVPPVQAPLPPDYSMSTVSHPVQIAGNTPQQVPCFPAGAAVSHDKPGYSSVYGGPQAGLSNQKFQQNQQYQHCQATILSRSFPPVTLTQPPSSQFSYNKPTIQQQMPQPRPLPPPPPFSHPHTSASHSEGMRQFGDEQWRPASAEYKADSQHNSWANGGRMTSCPSANFIGEAYFRPSERALADSTGYQVAAPNPAMPGPSTSGHSVNQMLPARPDMSSLNCWRPL